MHLKLSLALAALLAATAAPAQLQPKDLFSLQVASDPQVRPDGKAVAYVRATGDVMNDRMNRSIWMIDLASGAQAPIAAGPGQHASPRWSPDGKRLAYVSYAEGEKPQLWVRWMDSGTVARVATLPEAPRSLRWSPDGRSIAFAMFVPGEAPRLGKAPDKPEGAKWADPVRYTDQLVYRTDSEGLLRAGDVQLFIVSASGGAPRQLTRDKGGDPGPLAFTPDGRAILIGANRKPGADRDPVESEIIRIPVDGGDATRLTNRDGPDSEPAVSPDGRLIAYTGFDDRKRNSQDMRLYVMNADGSNPRLLTGGFDRPISRPMWSPDGRSILALTIDRGEGKVVRVGLDGKVTTLAGGLAGGSLDRPYSGGDYHAAGNVVAFVAGDEHRPGDIAVSRRGRTTRLTDLNADLLAARKLGEVRKLAVTSSRDGAPIDTWVVLPSDYRPGEKRPTILEIHGGPASSYGANFGTDMQLYAAAGYVVVYPNARLSTSYGEAFSINPDPTQPFADYADFMSAVDAAVAAGYADPANLFVTGGSYGGYAAAAIIGKTDRFRAAALQKPVINWVSKILNTDIIAAQYEYTYGKQPWDNPEILWRNSPLSLVGNVKTPTLVVVGERDYRTPISESEQYYGALQLRGIPSGLMVVPGANHGGLTARPSQSAAKASAIIAWFDRYRTVTK
ncbi:dipeptidyl aminopeptidase/acylaminoacyl peptidase [Sphingomonas kaistensis]|uniref:Dipeptidyl aminopeptidase/acylaminoacyl peptidase n=1 Tax=Sphingomonas kaistensis TaxID=298708 RepID=A0A7X5Y5S9_9SPHN|nr:S9 family peptidase [Sphingomonas kaistensis]NJC05283.1 dipeptidyl aminopeptidase/acylaminoacyl peptidase [Sphingomonas kaistensis]